MTWHNNVYDKIDFIYIFIINDLLFFFKEWNYFEMFL